MIYESKFLSRNDIKPIAELENSYGNGDIPQNMRILNFLSKISSRAIIAKDDSGATIGHYVYAPATRWLAVPTTLIPILKSIKDLGIDIDLCTVPVFAHLQAPMDTLENYLDFNSVRISDAISQGYSYGVVGLNQDNPSMPKDACYQAAWLLEPAFPENTNSTMREVGTHDNKMVYIQDYGVSD
jgi:hypothetical protein